MPRNAIFVTPRTTTLLEIRRRFSIAPTAITFFALAGDAIESGLPLPPLGSPLPELPAEKTASNGCGPVTPGSASKVVSTACPT